MGNYGRFDVMSPSGKLVKKVIIFSKIPFLPPIREEEHYENKSVLYRYPLAMKIHDIGTFIFVLIQKLPKRIKVINEIPIPPVSG